MAKVTCMENDHKLVPHSVLDIEKGALAKPVPSALETMVDAYHAASDKDRLMMQQKVQPQLVCRSCGVQMDSVPEFINHNCESNQREKKFLCVYFTFVSLAFIIGYIVTAIVCPECIPEKHRRY